MEIGISLENFLKKRERQKRPDVERHLVSMSIVGSVLNQMKGGDEGLKVKKAIRIGTRPERIISEIKSKQVIFTKGDDGDGVITVKTGRGEEYLRLSLEWFESAQIENNYNTGEKSLILCSQGKLTEGGNPKRTVWRFSPLKSK